MSGVLGIFEKQPADVLDYDCDFSDWLADRADTITSQTVVSSDSALVVGSVSQVNGVVKAFVSGGTDGGKYKLTYTVVTDGGRTKQVEITVKVKEV